MVTLSLHRLIDAQDLPASEQAAMLFAQGQSEAAQALLEDELTLRNGLDERLWGLLFALLRTQGDWRRFDALADRYSAVTGHPAPTWLEQRLLRRLPDAMRPGGAAYVALIRVPPQLCAAVAQIGRQQPGVHLDLSRLERLDTADAIGLTAALEDLAQDVVPVVISGTDLLAGRLHDDLIARPDDPLRWRLLFALYRLQDLADEFHRAALEYSLATGCPAPPWVPPLTSGRPLREFEEKRRTPRYEAESIQLRGRIEKSADLPLELLRDDRQERQYVNVDLSQLRCIAPSPAAALVGVANDLAAWGKVVRLLRPHALIETLLRALCLDARIELVGAQS